MPQYNPSEIEKYWQQFWEQHQTFKATENPDKIPYYILDMFPYPSGAGLHVGHPLGYIASDVVARYKRLKGFEVLHPMGYDAFGLPAEQFAIDTGNHPSEFTDKNIARYEQQLKMIGLSFDWSRKVKTSDPKFYKWTQWIFIQLFESWYNPKTNCAEHINDLIHEFETKGSEGFTAEQWNNFSEKEQQDILMDYRMAYIGESEVNWCPALGTVLANEEVKDGVSERGGYPVEKRKMRQWFLRITAYADRLLQDLNDIDWPQAVKDMQTNWIGKSIGAEVEFRLTPSPSPRERGAKTEGDKSPSPGGEESARNRGAESDESEDFSPLPGSRAGGEATGGEAMGYRTADLKIWQSLKANGRENRKTQTESEEILWQELRNRKLGFKFRRQHALNKYIADFICLEKNLIIEVDGEIHENQKEQDAYRTSVLNELGFEVIRFTNDEILCNIDSVLEKIKNRLSIIKDGDLPSERSSLPVSSAEDKSSEFAEREDSFPPLPGRGAGGEAVGGEATIKIFTTRPDTIFGATFMVLAPEHELVEMITIPAQKAEVEKYVAQAKLKTERERKSETKMTGVFSGAYAINPFTKKEIPIWIADYVLGDYGTGAIMAVPRHDSRDFEFATQFKLPKPWVIKPNNIDEEKLETLDICYDAKEGSLINSDFLNGLDVDQAIKMAIKEIESDGLGKKKINYRLRDANFSRQRYWGEPFPIVYKNGIPSPVPVDELPVELPEVQSYKPTGSGESPLAAVEDWVNTPEGRRETNTMPGWAGSSWYDLRYMDPHNDDEFVSKEKERYWKNVDFYIGGAEHATGHLLYSRFWHKFLFDRGLVDFKEPFKKLINQGMIQGVSQYALNQVVVYSANSTGNFEFLGSKLHKNGVLQLATVPNDLEMRMVYSADYFDKYYKDHAKLEEWHPISEKHIPIEFVNNGIVNLKALRNWRPEYKYACFVTLGGVYISDNVRDISSNVVENLDGQNFIPTDKEGSVDFRAQPEVEKMSKSKYNVINPDEVIEKYGCDAFRMYEMFLGPIEQSKPWDTKGIDGVSRFLKRFWGLFYDRNGNWIVNEDQPNPEELKVLHKTIKKTQDDIERFNLNTCVSSFMIAVNELSALNCHKRDILKPLNILIAPYAAHTAEELWKALGPHDITDYWTKDDYEKGSIAYAKFPVYNQSYTAESNFEYPVSINGKLRVKLELPLSLGKEQVEEEVKKLDLTKWTDGKPLKKIILVPGKIVNVVV